MNVPLVSSPYYSYKFPDRHRFPMQKFRYLLEFLTDLGIATPSNVFRPGRVRLDVLHQAHCHEYVRRFVSGLMTDREIRRLGLPWSLGLVKRTLISPNGTLLTCHLALRYGMACHLAGGTHHAHRDFASGYCIFNDLAVAALTALAQSKVERVLIVDCDVHQGDGTAAILQSESRITTCSIHCEKNFPARKQRSDIDVELPIGTGDAAYLAALNSTLKKAIEQSRPQLIIYDAGVDIYQHDPLGLLDVTLSGIRRRDALVLTTAMEQNIPIATVIGGGYDRDQKALAQRHAVVVQEAQRCYQGLK